MKLSTFLAAAVLALYCLSSASALIEFYGIEGKCADLFCSQLAIELWKYDDHSQSKIAVLLPAQPRADALSYFRYHAYDETKNVYYAAFKSSVNDQFAVQLVTVDINSATVVNTVVLDSSQSDLQDLQGLEFDSTTGLLLGVFDNIVAVVDEASGMISPVGQMWDSATSKFNVRVTTFDQAKGNLFVAVQNIKSLGVYDLVQYNFAANSTIVITNVGKHLLYPDVPMGMTMNTNTGEVIWQIENQMGGTLLQVNPATGAWKELSAPEGDIMSNWDCFDLGAWNSWGVHTPMYSKATNSIWALWMDGSDDSGLTSDMIRFDINKAELYDSWGISTDVTNFVFIKDL